MKNNWDKRLILSLTGDSEKHWRDKINEINDLGLKKIALFLEYYKKDQREMIYKALEESCVEEIPLVHIKNDMDRYELKYLKDKYFNSTLTIHENSFDYVEKWHGFYKSLYLEMNFDNFIAQNVKVEKIGGFCVDLAHFKAGEEKWSKDFEYVLKRRKNKNIFTCNHLGGYSYEKNLDVHVPTSVHQFDYLKTLPDFVFSDIIAIEITNSIADQIKYKKYILEILKDK